MFFKKKGVLLLTLVTCIWTLFGCGEPKVPETPEEEMLIITEDGTVREVLVEDFDKDYFDIKELETFVKDEASTYNQKHSEIKPGPVTVTNVNLLNPEGEVRRAKVEMTYQSCHTYADYNEAVLYCGSVAEGTYLMGESRIPAEYEENTVIITNQPRKLYAPRKVKWISGAYPVLKDGSVDLSELPEGEKVAIVIK